MQVRKLPVSQGLAWFRSAIDIGGRNPKAVFGAALLFIAVFYGLALLLAVVAAALVKSGTPSPSLFLAVFVPLFLAIMVLMPILIGGLMHVIREAEAARPVRARDLFAPFRLGSAKPLAALGLLQIALAVLGALLMVAVAGADYWKDYMAAMQSAMGGATPAMPQPRHPGLLFLLQLAFNYFTYAIMLFSVPLVLFSRAPLLDAVRASLGASVRNVGANLLAAALFVGGTIVAAIVVALLAWLAGLVGGLVHVAVGTLLSMAILLGFGAVLLVVLAGCAYLAWRDTFDAPAPPPSQRFEGIEA
jgi:hypothetical protein